VRQDVAAHVARRQADAAQHFFERRRNVGRFAVEIKLAEDPVGQRQRRDELWPARRVAEARAQRNPLIFHGYFGFTELIISTTYFWLNPPIKDHTNSFA
jgi:hypothetical protein